MAENFANTFQTTLVGAINNSVTSLSVLSVTGAPSVNFRLKLDSEYVLVTAVGGSSATNYATVAQGHTPSASSTYSSYVSSQAFDVDDATFWVSVNHAGTGEWLKSDLGAAQTVVSYRVLQESTNAAASAYKVQSSTDNSNWTDRDSITTLTLDSGTVTLSSPISARYWRILGVTAQNTGFGWAIKTFALFSSGAYPLTVTRGIEGSTAASHSDGATVTHVLTAGGLSQAISEYTGAGGFTLLVNENGSSTTNWTSEAGTWSSSGGEFHQTDTGTYRRYRYNTKVPQAGPIVVKMDIRMPSSGQSGGGAGTGAGFLLHKDASGSNDAYLVQLVHNGTAVTQVGADRAGVAALRYFTFGSTIAFDTWIALMVVVGGQGFAAYYVNGVFQANMGYVGGNYSVTSVPDYFGLYTYNCKADFRNIKVYGPALP